MTDQAVVDEPTDPPNNPPEPPADPPADPPVEPPVEPTLADSDLDGLPPTSTWPDDWRKRFAGEDETALKKLNRYKSPENIFKAYRALEQKLSAGEYQKTKPDTEDAEALKAWRTEIGVPESPEGYLEKLDVEVPPEDQPVVDKYLERMHAEGASPKHVQDGLQWYYETQQQMADDRAVADKEFRQTSEDDLRAEWGAEFRGNLNGMRAMLDMHAPDGLKEEILTARTDDGRVLGDHPGFLKFLVNLSSEVNPMGTLTPAGGENRVADLEGEIKQLETEMADTKGKQFDYWANPTKQARLRELYEVQEKLKGRAA